MNLRPVSTVALLAALVAPAFAQSASSTDEEANLALTLPTDEWYVPKNNLNFGIRILNKGAAVRFGNLGSISNVRTTGPDASGNYVYDTGYVKKDALRDPFETKTAPDPDTKVGTPTFYGEPIGNGRYRAHQVTRAEEGGPLTDKVVGEGLSYDAAFSREWSASSTSLIDGSLLRMSNYSATSEGAFAEKEEGANSGIELSMSRVFGKLGKRLEWGIAGGIALNPINAKTGGAVRATLSVYSDYFRIGGTLPDGVKSGPTFTDFDTTVDGDDQSLETTVPVGAAPDTTVAGTGKTVTTVGGATIDGNWKIKGAYFLMRVGPQIRAQLTERLGVSASLGMAGAFSGTRYSVVESLTVSDLPTPITEEADDSKSAFLGGIYADVNLDWAATERTGFYAGVNMQKFGSYDMEVGGRTAKIDFGNAVGIRGGMNFKF
ncbi:MAG: hypothetical protein KF715_02030 [Candidatus Didemnitutus sp.]|nr:hypothetical protein [Candidatus Didemnitutus sp.]